MKRLEYIQYNGNAYIDTGIKNVDYCKVETKFKGLDTKNDQSIFGYSSNNYHFTWYDDAWYYGSEDGIDKDNFFTCDYTILDEIELVYNNENNKISINGIEIGQKPDVEDNYWDRTMCIFRRHADAKMFDGRIYYFRIINKQTQKTIMDLIPAENDDGKVGMYDKISDKFYSSMTNSNFIAGPSVDLLYNLKRIYTDKQTNLLPENIRKDITILGVTGTVEEGTVDTSDADATEVDILEGKTVYVKSEKIVGAMKNYDVLDIVPDKERQIISSGYVSSGTIQPVDITGLEDYKLCLDKANYILSNNPYVIYEYLESIGQAYINTNYIFKENTKIEIKFYAPSSNKERYACLFGARKGDYNNNAYVFFWRFKDSSFCYCRTGNESTGTPIYDKEVTLITQGTQATYSYDDTSKTITTSGTPDEGYNSLLLFNNNTSNNTDVSLDTTDSTGLRIYYCKIWEGEELIRDYIPVKNIKTNEFGLLDRKSNTFYQSPNTSSSNKFIGGR